MNRLALLTLSAERATVPGGKSMVVAISAIPAREVAGLAHYRRAGAAEAATEE